MQVQDLMSTALVTVHPEELVDSADFDMRLASIRHIPVVDERNRLVGIVSDRDLLLALGQNHDKPLRIRDVMTGNVETTGEFDRAADAVKVMMRRKIGCLPVVGDEGQLVGVVTETDFMRLAHQTLVGQPVEEAY